MPRSALQREFEFGGNDPAYPGESDCFFEGFLTAIAVCPVDLTPQELAASDAIADGSDDDFASALWHMRDILLFMPDKYAPGTIGDGPGRRRQAITWAFGFVNGVRLKTEVWERWMRREDYSDAAGPIFELAVLHPDFPGNFKPPPGVDPLTDADIDECIDWLPGIVVDLFNFRGEAIALRNEPFPRATPKAGRNEPCPCGSGKKYKKCCGA